MAFRLRWVCAAGEHDRDHEDQAGSPAFSGHRHVIVREEGPTGRCRCDRPGSSASAIDRSTARLASRTGRDFDLHQNGGLSGAMTGVVELSGSVIESPQGPHPNACKFAAKARLMTCKFIGPPQTGQATSLPGERSSLIRCLCTRWRSATLTRIKISPKKPPNHLARWPVKIRGSESSPPETPASCSGSQRQTCRVRRSGGHLDRWPRSRRERYGNRTDQIPKASRQRAPRRNSHASNPVSTPTHCRGPEKCSIGSTGTNQRALSAVYIRRSGCCRRCKCRCSSPASAKL